IAQAGSSTHPDLVRASFDDFHLTLFNIAGQLLIGAQAPNPENSHEDHEECGDCGRGGICADEGPSGTQTYDRGDDWPRPEGPADHSAGFDRLIRRKWPPHNAQHSATTLPARRAI